ncbi:MAG TPA: TaqI-like C-terminal specificity domain-containing protein [Kiritimatiellia bacterium]|nr:TaqI-like C-terminal specificity domain-containing protein [Kiritimatiellia bacterium]HMO99364.1 TaqI-like C-terminal specificity domain-containing protein [Kiritimatiellia bacterium]HMP95649.1 TaqI-like C-terminal specificity domain-containing protein [Kiritimatiellia bacterium]
MTRAEIQTALQLPYQRKRWLDLLAQILPHTQAFATPQLLASPGPDIVSAWHLATIPLADGKNVAVLEVEVSGRVDLLRNRVGLRNLVAGYIDQDKAHAVIGLFRGSGSEDADYRLSFVARSSEFSADGALSRTETDKRRYTYILGRGQPCRTPAERLDGLRLKGAAAILDDLLAAFKVEPLFKEFFKDYGRVFGEVEALVRPTLPDPETLRLFTQRLFNRLMFLAFIERKGWLRFGPHTDYLAALARHYDECRSAHTNFYRDHLVPLFFEGLNQPDRPAGHADPRFGSVPYLNGGLFEKAEDGTDDLPGLVVPDAALAAIQAQLFDRYNFTVAESTPLDVEVAVDPEMLGKVFEELVTGRHEQGSYYTPKPIVSFMGRAAIVEYLATRCPGEDRAALEAFVHDHVSKDLRDAEAILAALRRVTVCDPACGSGAYLLGMLHELLDLRTCLFQTTHKLDALTAHARKLEIIERNLYGVDLDPFAVHIARLRLWLSLAVEYDGHDTPPALPNLDFKIEQGDSLAGLAPADVLNSESSLGIIRPTVIEFRKVKADYLRAHGERKAALRGKIAELKATLHGWLATEGPANAFQWAIEFAEVFLPEPAPASITGDLNLGDELAAPPAPGGFDIVVANPPYVRMELIKPQKPILRKRFPHVHAERADLYVYFYARAHQLLRPGGVAAFISSNKWLRAGYGEPLRQHLLDAQAFPLIMDFGDQPVFESATAYPCIFIWKNEARGQSATHWASVKELDACYAEGVRAHFLRVEQSVPAAQFGPGMPRLATNATADLRGRMGGSGIPLREFLKGPVCRGVVTGLNGAFIIPQSKRDELVAATPAVAEIIKPLVEGDNVRRFEIQYRGQFLIYTYHGIDIGRFPSVREHLRPYKTKLEARATQQAWYELQQPQMAYRDHFAGPKIIYPDIGKELRFAVDTTGYFGANTTYFLPIADWFVCAVLNSVAVRQWIEGSLNDLRGGYLRFFGQHMEQIPIPDAPTAERAVVAGLAERAQELHGQRRARVEAFLRALGLDPAESTSRNPLEQPWSLTPSDFAKRSKPYLTLAREKPQRLYESARDETATLTEQIAQIESEIDARVATLYGLDAEDQRWAAKSASAARPDDKDTLFFSVLGGLKERAAYFSFKAIQTAANDAELELGDGSLKVYLNKAVKQGLLHDAGRGWYSRLGEPVRLDPQPVARLIRATKKAFPLLDFSVWSTAQLNPWMHHLLAQPVHFLYVNRDDIESVAETLSGQGWDVAENPTPTQGGKAVRPGEKMVVIRPIHSKQPAPNEHQSAIEHMLVDLLIETGNLGLMDTSEARGTIARILDVSLIQLASLQNFADHRGVDLAFLSLS